MGISGSELMAAALKRAGVDVVFFLLGGPMVDAVNACERYGIRCVDVRHEQAAAMMATGYSRVLNRPGVCIAASGPGLANLVSGVANAFVDGAPVVAIGGSSALNQVGMGAFQEIDQVAMMKPVTIRSERVLEARRIPEIIQLAIRDSHWARPGPIYVDLPGDVLYDEVDEAEVRFRPDQAARQRPLGDPVLIDQAVALLELAERPIIYSGSGVLWGDASGVLTDFVESSGIPVFATPQGRGAVPDDHPLCFLHARGTALRGADLVMVVGSRMNYMIGYGRAPRIARDAKLIQIDIDPAELGRNRPADVAIIGDVASVLRQLIESGRLRRERYSSWIKELGRVDREKAVEQEHRMNSDQIPIHPLRMCKEVRDFMDRDAILVVDGQEILNYARQSIPTYLPRHRLNSGPFGTMGVGLPLGLGAKIAAPDQQVIVLHGDGSFGINALEVDTAVRHNISVITVISNNGGWSATDRYKAGRDLAYSRYDRMAQVFGCHAEHVESPAEIRPALERAAASGVPAVINVLTDPTARAGTIAIASYAT
jgi:thiamine pyrophosphate-dependent acetolactate synthase large subunit-like protein